MPRMTMEKVKTKFFECLEEEWGSFIERACYAEAAFHHDPMLSNDDLKQDVFEYIYRYCFAEVYKRSKNGTIWMPYLRNSIRNCFVNTRKSKKNWRIRLDMVGTDASEMEFLADTKNEGEHCFYDQRDIEADFEYEEYCHEVATMLTKQEQMIFYALLNPSKEFSNFIKVRTFGRSNTRITKTMVSDFFGLNYGTVIEAFKKFRNTIELSTATV